MKKILYFDCFSGISGNMVLGALLDLGIEETVFLEELKKLDIDGIQVKVEMVDKKGIQAKHVTVIDQQEETVLSKSEHSHSHIHRNYRDIKNLIEESRLKENVKNLSLRIFTRVAAAEAKVHGKNMEEIHFHEVGAIDSIVDIVGTAILIDMLQPQEIYASVIQDGYGFIQCQHGLLAVPVPAVSEIFASAKVPVRQIDEDTELVTPTGAAIIAELAISFGIMPQMTVHKIGWGAGSKPLKAHSAPNVLKVCMGETDSEACLPSDMQVGNYADIDLQRAVRQGMPEVIYGEGKTAEQITGIVKAMKSRKIDNIMITRLSKQKAEQIGEELELYYQEIPRIGIANYKEADKKGKVVIAAAGTSDLPVAEEAAITAELYGNYVERIYDVGVAGIHRLLNRVSVFEGASAVIVVAGMEGALTSVIGGLVSCPVIGVPTSVGYGANFGGLAALLSMLNSCASGVSVVNIDNGFGAGVLASKINRQSNSE